MKPEYLKSTTEECECGPCSVDVRARVGRSQALAVRALASPGQQRSHSPAPREEARCGQDTVRGGSLPAEGRTPGAEAQSFGLLDPKLCYLLDGILFIYGIIITALFLRAKFSGSADAPEHLQGPNQVYNELNLGRREEYDLLDKRRGRDPEMGGKQQRRKNPQEGLYNALQREKMAEAYSEIGTKGDGLSTATKDTYDALHMQALPPR
ncbi:T-cell surface glycoprotein CD3 zeta chain [Myotis brandtii]|uniref:T-cell surface glycoprotein CD3 zeta chain n=1 Tax=Myotis brandtii TaxID=109478 RepID=S7NGL0_MYOBR|nr:T-cell surface glycoprotein CD3 zeta chain [Myotis brandtii]